MISVEIWRASTFTTPAAPRKGNCRKRERCNSARTGSAKPRRLREHPDGVLQVHTEVRGVVLQ